MVKVLFSNKLVVMLAFLLVFTFSFSACRSSKNNQSPLATQNKFEPDSSLAMAPSAPKALYPKEERQSAPLFELPYAIGGNFSLSEYLGNVILLDFTATWCYWCDQQAPDVDEVVESYKGQKVKFFAVNVREAPEVVLEKYPSGEKTYPILVDVIGDVLFLYEIQGFPTFVVIDQEGKIAYKQNGHDENFTEKMSDIIDYLLISKRN